MMEHHKGPVFIYDESPTESFASKPLPRLPRWWERILHETSLLLRSFGLGVIVTAFRGVFSNDFSEPAKIAIRRNRVTASLRTLIHAVPLGVALLEIILNWNGRFIGTHTLDSTYLQFAAKAHEMAVQVSVATIVLSYVRHHMVNKGMPFGAALAGLHSFQINYLWSLEFWSSMWARDFHLKRKLPFAILTLIGILVTTLAGPSSANLLIARTRIWTTKPAYVAFGATSQDIWPNRFDGEDIPKDCAVTTLGSMLNEPDCPLSNLLYYLDTPAFELSREQPSKQITFEAQNMSVGFIKEMVVAPCLSSLKDQFCATVPHEAILGGLATNTLSQPQYKDKNSCIDAYQRIREDYFQPYTIASCLTDVATDLSDQSPLRYPRISESESDLSHDREIVPVSELTKGHALQISGNTSQYLVDWVDLPRNLGNGMPGVVVVHPRGSDHLFNITTCTLAAGWGSSELSTHFQDLGMMYGQIIDTPSSWRVHDNVKDTYGYVKNSWPDFGNISNYSYPQRRIDVSKRWAEFLNPRVILPDDSNTTSISLFLSELNSPPSQDDVARVLAASFASGLSMAGLDYGWEVFPNKSAAKAAVCDNCLVLTIQNSIFGWTYSAQETTIKLAICVMVAYCILVAAHVAYSVFTGISSTAWDSAAEMIVLAMNSSSTEILQNTCAGIIGKKVFETPVRILATDEQHLELVFGGESETAVQSSTLSGVMMNEEYGRLLTNRKRSNSV